MTKPNALIGPELNARVLTLSKTLSFGRTEYRPECKGSKLVCTWLGQNNLSEQDVKVLKELGFTLQLKVETL